MAEKDDWQGRTGDAWAQEWRRTDRSFSHLTEQLLAGTRGFAFDRVLDVGCGAGELSLAIARGRPEATVIGVDVSPRLIEVAKERGAHRANASFELADAADWQSEPGAAPELLISRHGVMFFADPVAAFANLAKQGADGAGLLFSCFRSRSENPLFADVLRLLPNPPEAVDPYAPGPFAFADPTRVAAILSQAGWKQVQLTPFDFPMIAGAGEHAIEEAMAYFKRIGPAARALTELDTGSAERFLKLLRALVERNCHHNIVAFRAAAWMVTARKV
ncbi:class I SAM-dependent methyltransferase [Aurantiacibacter marinus]|uniref:Methyltransferase domain-containing protein n=1 Tax=Aurantiacibacter marinus TaxID=874156 RepID=A0A0H0XLY1_9SPHN|nr:class I SAM-dependent methyltransferase [Aurantiacibacter marinus]KLI63613.1 hypothetical protein AAV99_07640 [Aurantiacibacter marinus]